MWKTIRLTEAEIEQISKDAAEFGCKIAAYKHGLTKSYVGRLWKAYKTRQANPALTEQEFLDIARGSTKSGRHTFNSANSTDAAKPTKRAKSNKSANADMVTG